MRGSAAGNRRLEGPFAHEVESFPARFVRPKHPPALASP